MNKLDSYYENEYSNKVAALQAEEVRTRQEYLAEQKICIDAFPKLIQETLASAEVSHPKCERLLERSVAKKFSLITFFSTPLSYFEDEKVERFGWKVYGNIYLLTSGRLVHYRYEKKSGGMFISYLIVDEIEKDVDLYKINAIPLYFNLLNLCLSFQGNPMRYLARY